LSIYINRVRPVLVPCPGPRPLSTTRRRCGRRSSPRLPYTRTLLASTARFPGGPGTQLPRPAITAHRRPQPRADSARRQRSPGRATRAGHGRRRAGRTVRHVVVSARRIRRPHHPSGPAPSTCRSSLVVRGCKDKRSRPHPLSIRTVRLRVATASSGSTCTPGSRPRACSKRRDLRPAQARGVLRRRLSFARDAVSRRRPLGIRHVPPDNPLLQHIWTSTLRHSIDGDGDPRVNWEKSRCSSSTTATHRGTQCPMYLDHRRAPSRCARRWRWPWTNGTAQLVPEGGTGACPTPARRHLPEPCFDSRRRHSLPDPSHPSGLDRYPAALRRLVGPAFELV